MVRSETRNRIHVREDLCNFGEISSCNDQGWVEVTKPVAKTHLKDVAVAPAALARPGGDGSEDTTWKKRHLSFLQNKSSLYNFLGVNLCVTWFFSPVSAQGLRRAKEYAKLVVNLRHCSWKWTIRGNCRSKVTFSTNGFLPHGKALMVPSQYVNLSNMHLLPQQTIATEKFAPLPVPNWSRRGFSTSLVFCSSAYFLAVFLLILRFSTAWAEICTFQYPGCSAMAIFLNNFFSADLERMMVVFRKWSQLGRSFDHHLFGSKFFYKFSKVSPHQRRSAWLPSFWREVEHSGTHTLKVTR